MIAQVADYDVITPPRELLGDGSQAIDLDGVIDWVKRQDSKQLKGVIVALDPFISPTTTVQVNQRLQLLNWLRQQNPDVLIYGFASQSHPALSAFVFDDLVLAPPATDSAHLLLARFLQRVHQRPIKILPLTSAEVSAATVKALTEMITAVGGQLVTTGKADIFLFLHTPNTDATKLANFTNTLVNTAASGYYVALADVSGNPESLLTVLRERKQLDLLQAYAAAPELREGSGKVLAHCAARLIAAKVLRPSLDLEQLRRAERAQVELMLTRYLEDWAYASNLRARLEQHVKSELKADPARLGVATEQAEAFANAELKRVADDLFRTQFRYNLHSVLLGNGQRADFQVEMLQLFKARFPLQRIDELELNLSVYLSLLVNIYPRPDIR
jgi:hypothetical protein